MQSECVPESEGSRRSMECATPFAARSPRSNSSFQNRPIVAPAGGARCDDGCRSWLCFGTAGHECMAYTPAHSAPPRLWTLARDCDCVQVRPAGLVIPHMVRTCVSVDEDKVAQHWLRRLVSAERACCSLDSTRTCYSGRVPQN